MQTWLALSARKKWSSSARRSSSLADDATTTILRRVSLSRAILNANADPGECDQRTVGVIPSKADSAAGDDDTGEVDESKTLFYRKLVVDLSPLPREISHR